MLNRYSVAQKSGAVGCVLGSAWLFFLGVLPLVQVVPKANDWLDLLFRLVLPLILGGFGVLLIVLSVRLMRNPPTREGIKNLFGVLCGFLTFLSAFGLLPQAILFICEDCMPGRYMAVLIFLSMLVLLPIYAGLSSLVLQRSGITPVKGEFVGRGSYLVFALLLWVMLQGVLPSHFERIETGTPLDLLVVMLPVVIPYVLYRLAVKYLVRETIEQEVALDHPSKAEAAG